MVLGGLGNIWGTIAGACILGLVENLSIGLDFWGYSLPAGYKDAFAFVIILAVLLFKPQGLFGTRSRVA
jgi:branched-chain amino acid transport system permease protein